MSAAESEGSDTEKGVEKKSKDKNGGVSSIRPRHRKRKF